MQRLESISALRERLAALRAGGRSVGLVPTMGYLHHGHMALVAAAKARGDVVVVSIFVNPTQFAPNEDFATYPRDMDRDLALSASNEVDIVFTPAVEEMYSVPIQTRIEVAPLSSILIGLARPTHFSGVATVVAKLLNVAQPARAYFGEKDFQQLTIVRTMVRDLSMPVEIVGVPTAREADGLAASSRNVRLTPQDRAAASVIPRALERGAAMASSGTRDPAAILAAMRDVIGAEPRAELRSLDIRDAATLGEVDDLAGRRAVILVTARFGRVVLIDQREIGGA